jgi:hypothetical protein
MAELRDYCTDLSAALDEKDGILASELLSVKDHHAENRRLLQSVETAQVIICIMGQGKLISGKR